MSQNPRLHSSTETRPSTPWPSKTLGKTALDTWGKLLCLPGWGGGPPTEYTDIGDGWQFHFCPPGYISSWPAISICDLCQARCSQISEAEYGHA